MHDVDNARDYIAGDPRQSMDGVGGVMEVTLVHPHLHLRYLLLVVSGRFSSCYIMDQLL
jgi:hypothetical protein